ASTPLGAALRRKMGWSTVSISRLRRRCYCVLSAVDHSSESICSDCLVCADVRFCGARPYLEIEWAGASIHTRGPVSSGAIARLQSAGIQSAAERQWTHSVADHHLFRLCGPVLFEHTFYEICRRTP